MSIFALHFRNHAVPALRAEINKQAFLICCEMREFDEACDEVCGFADKLGRWNLPDGKVAELNDWIMTTLSQAIAEARPRVDQITSDNERRRIADPVAHYEHLAIGCTRPAAMRWVFAAISPEYRAHLLAVSRERA